MEYAMYTYKIKKSPIQGGEYVSGPGVSTRQPDSICIFFPAGKENKGVAAVKPSASGAHPRRIGYVRVRFYPTNKKGTP